MKIKKFLYSQKVAPYVFVIPFILSFAIFWIYPLCSSVFMSFEKITPLETGFVGIDNYKKLLSDTVFHTAIKNSATYMFWTLVLLIPFPMLFAVLMDSNLVKAKGVWKAVLYMPALTSVVISGTLFRLMFTEYSTGQMNKIVMALGMEPFKWLKVGWTGMAALLVLACWRWTGVNILYFLAGLQSISTDLYEAASIDGASKWQQFKKISFPLVKPTTVYVLTISIYAGLSMFLESYMLWKGNNSPQNIGLTIVGYLYRQGIEKRAMGYACAVGLVLLIVVMIVNLIQLTVTGTFKKEER